MNAIGDFFVLISTVLAIVGLGYLAASALGPVLETTLLEILRDIQRKK